MSDNDDKPRRISKTLLCQLNDDEKQERGLQLAAKDVEIQELESQIADINTTKRPLVKERKALARLLHRGTEERKIMCEVHEGPGVNVRIIRGDTKEVIEERAMTPAERQGDWLAETEKAVEKAKRGRKPKAEQAGSGGDEDDSDDEQEGGKVLPFGSGRSSAKKAARKPKSGGKGKRKR